jgi:subtilisin family serine protease
LNSRFGLSVSIFFKTKTINKLLKFHQKIKKTMYKITYGGKKGKTVNLVESNDLVAIRTKKGKSLESLNLSARSRGMMNTVEEVGAFPDAGVTIVKMKADTVKMAVEMRDATRAALKTEGDIRFAGRVLEDEKSGAFMLYTENFFLKFKDDVAEARCEELIAKYHLKIKNKVVFAPNSYFVTAPEGTGLKVFDIAQTILTEKEVENCHPETVQERRFKAAINPLQWHLKKTTINGSIVDAGINVEEAWKITQGEGVTIAIIDDGVDTTHPEFAGKIVHPRDVTIEDNDANPKEENDMHGTACAGVAVASGKDSSGVAPKANLMPIRCRSGLGSMSEANAFVWAADNGADVISCSWGPTDGQWWNPGDRTHKQIVALPDSSRLAMDYAMTKGRGGKGCSICFAAGNGNEKADNDGYASNPAVITVAACNDRGKRSVYSDFGTNIWVSFPSGDFEYEPFKHPAPISEGIRTTDRIAFPGYESSDYTNSFGGTSSACPGVAGVIGLMISANPNLSPPQIKSLLRKSCIKIDEAGGKYNADGHSIIYGYGRLDAGLAVKNAVEAKNQPVEVAEKPPISIEKPLPKPSNEPDVEGKFRFAKRGELTVQNGQIVGDFLPAQKLLGFSLKLKNLDNSLIISYKGNVKGVIEQGSDGKYVGSLDAKNRLIGFSVELSGAAAKQFSVEYTAKFMGSTTTKTAKNGAFLGTDKKTGKAIEIVSVKIVKKV